MDIGQNGTYTDLTFATWMVYNVPPMLVNVIIAWVYLIIIFFGFSFTKGGNASRRLVSKKSQRNVEKMLNEKYRALGSMTFHEFAVATLFVFAVSLWLFREPKFIPGWSSMITGNSNFRIGDSTAAMLVVMLLFIIPKKPTSILKSMKYSCFI